MVCVCVCVEGSYFIGYPHRKSDVKWNCLGSLHGVAYVLVKDAFRWNSKLFWKPYSQNDSKGILQIPLCVVAKLIRPRSKSQVYLVEKDSGYCIIGIVETKLAGPLLISLAQP